MPQESHAPRILHLEDDSNDAALIQFHLKTKKFPCVLTWVCGEADFRAALSRGDVDLILSDYRMPGYDGDRALRFVRENYPHLPFIMLTGELGEDRAIETLKRGATDYVLKGNLARLVPSIERSLREAALDDERRRAERELKSTKDQLTRELADMRRLHELNISLLEEEGIEPLLQRVLQACLELVGADKGNVQIYDEEAQGLAIAAQVGFGEEFLDHFRWVAAGRNCACGKALEEGRIVIRDVFTDERFEELRPFFEKEGLTSVVSSPLVGRARKLFGMLSVHFRRPHTLTQRELDLLDLYIQQAERVIASMRDAVVRRRAR